MFDIGFWELIVIGAVALIVFGPDRLPQLARRAGYWIGRARRQLNEIRADIEREMVLDEVRRADQEIRKPLTDMADQIRSAAPFGPPAAGEKTQAGKPVSEPTAGA